MIKPTCQTCISALDCEQYGDPWRNNQPCEAMEEYASQDHVGRKERLLADNNIIPGNWPKPATSVAIIQLFFTDRKSITEIAEIVNKSHQYVSKVINQSKKILHKNLKKQVANPRK